LIAAHPDFFAAFLSRPIGKAYRVVPQNLLCIANRDAQV
jgi:hypothetical protein